VTLPLCIESGGMDNPQGITDSYCSSCLGGWPHRFQYGHVSIFNSPTKLFADRSGGEATPPRRGSVKVSETSRAGGRVTPTTANYNYSTHKLNLSSAHTTLGVKHLWCQPFPHTQSPTRSQLIPLHVELSGHQHRLLTVFKHSERDRYNTHTVYE